MSPALVYDSVQLPGWCVNLRMHIPDIMMTVQHILDDDGIFFMEVQQQPRLPACAR